jgi:hypothetical protein
MSEGVAFRVWEGVGRGATGTERERDYALRLS